ncbi:MAG: DUF1549 domain-containing protein [Blastocatellia bacterium]
MTRHTVKTVVLPSALPLLLFACALFLVKTAPLAQQPAPAQTQRAIDFNRDVRPILSDKCFACHGPDAPNKRIKLRLDSEAGALADLGRGRHAVVPGAPDKSELVRRINAGDEDMRMPPGGSGRTVSPKEIETLTAWISQGAKWSRHWSFVPPVRPALPSVGNTAWPKNPIDYFVLARLEREGLAPAPAADRATLLRRVTFDLTGLPPTPKELDAFEQDKTPGAYEKVVDRLLASPRYGERMAFRWLDAARYADTNGYQIDGERNAWRWRDWVIDAFNQNKPYDQFIVEQLAGDLLPGATPDQRIATAFNRNHRINAEGGIVPEEYRVEYVVDRVDTVSTVFMGLTMGCARCHNHKYDPLTQQEFYQLSAYFNNIAEDGQSFDYGNSPPWMLAPTKEQQREWQRLHNEIARADVSLAAMTRENGAAQEAWEKTLSDYSTKQQQWFPGDRLLVNVPLDENQAPVFNRSDRDYHNQDDKRRDVKYFKTAPGFREGAPRYVESPTGQGVAFDGKLYYDAGLQADLRYKSTTRDYRERFSIAAWFRPETANSGAIITKVSDTPIDIENNVPRAEGYGMYFLNQKLHFNMVFRWGEDTYRVETADTLPLNVWHHAAVVFDGTRQGDERIKIYLNGQEAKLQFNQRSFYLLMGGTNNTLKIGAGGGPRFRFRGAIDDARIYNRKLAAAEVGVLACGDTLEKIAAMPVSARTPAQALKLREAWIAIAAPENIREARQKLRELGQKRQEYEDSLPTLMVMEELSEARPAHVLKRGAYDAPGDQVMRAVPAVFPAMPAEYPNNRLGFAKWLTQPGHPLTARVAVNRLWQMIFGAGLVKTSEDFGLQGALPTHPELLDFLADEFTKAKGKRQKAKGRSVTDATSTGAWDIKHMLRLIVTSATYRQSSKIIPHSAFPTPPSTKIIPHTAFRIPQSNDAENMLLSRGPRFRLSADMIRDQALAVAGLLVNQVGGPSVKPYQPDGLYKDMAFSGLTSYSQDKGDGLWRRSLYTYWKRTVLAPNMQVFDASAREFCTVRDTRTNTPLQSLNLMNDITYIEAARMLAERMIRLGGVTTATRLAWGFRAVTSRRPTQAETDTLLRNFEKQTAHFRQNPDEAAKLLTVGERKNGPGLDKTEIAAYATVASLLLNLDEAITKQ